MKEGRSQQRGVTCEPRRGHALLMKIDFLQTGEYAFSHLNQGLPPHIEIENEGPGWDVLPQKEAQVALPSFQQPYKRSDDWRDIYIYIYEKSRSV